MAWKGYYAVCHRKRVAVRSARKWTYRDEDIRVPQDALQNKKGVSLREMSCRGLKAVRGREKEGYDIR